ncbi:MAG: Crp/Fnr family transcriptional regulator, partial [Nitrospinota bacterium]
MAELERITQTRLFEKDEIIFREGEPCGGMILLCQGKVKLFISAEDGRQRILDIAVPCEIIGEPALVDVEAHVLTAQAMEPVEIHAIDRTDLLAFLSKHGKVAIQLIHKLGGKLRSVRGKIGELAYHDARGRMAALLLRLDSLYGEKKKFGRSVVHLPLTREELAEMIGTTQETAIRILSQFRKEKLVELRNRRMVILEPEALNK